MLVGLTVLHLGSFVRSSWAELRPATGLAHADGSPLGGDFVNMFVTAKLMVAGRVAEIYQPRGVHGVRADHCCERCGSGLWAHPPHSLLFVWPLGYLDYWAGLVVWSVLGWRCLVWARGARGSTGSRRRSLRSTRGAVVDLFRADGKSRGGIAAARAWRHREGGPVAAALLTIKPQAGFLLPVLWLGERKFVVIAIAGGGCHRHWAWARCWPSGLRCLARLVFGPTLGLLNTRARKGRADSSP